MPSSPAVPISTPYHRFPPDFRWGAAAASYQIEGAVAQDGRGESIWDEFCRRPGAVVNGESGRVACDHYNRWAADLDMMQALGLQSYRLSVAWPRILPEGTGRINERGLDFYDRLIDGLLARGIAPAITCYHWDLPLALHQRGGWQERWIVDAFAEYCGVLARRLGDRVDDWFTLNEPWVAWMLGYDSGMHAPGLKLAPKPLRQVGHHMLMAHGAGVRALRAGAPRPIRVGMVNNCNVPLPMTEDEGDVAALRTHFRESNGWLLDPIFFGSYPTKEWNDLGANVPDVREGDMELIAAPTDFFGLNVYCSNQVVRAGGEVLSYEPWYPRTDMTWPVTPDVLYWGPRLLAEVYGIKCIYITENGAAYPDQVGPSGRVDDHARVNYLQQYLRSAHRAVAEGWPLKGYYVWSLMDNFEWSYGYGKRFGIVHINYETLERTPKASAHWYSRVIRNGGF